jgi:hypothetical protein
MSTTQALRLMATTMFALLALAVGVVLSYFVFPQPTMWRLIVIAVVIAAAVLPARRLARPALRRVQD